MKTRRELDVLVAKKVMGMDGVFIDPKGALRIPDGYTEYGRYCFSYGRSPSTDLTAAWEVLEQIEKDYGGFILTKGVDGGYYCGILLWDGVGHDIIAEANADTVPLAICLAALEAVDSAE